MQFALDKTNNAYDGLFLTGGVGAGVGGKTVVNRDDAPWLDEIKFELIFWFKCETLVLTLNFAIMLWFIQQPPP